MRVCPDADSGRRQWTYVCVCMCVCACGFEALTRLTGKSAVSGASCDPQQSRKLTDSGSVKKNDEENELTNDRKVQVMLTSKSITYLLAYHLDGAIMMDHCFKILLPNYDNVSTSRFQAESRIRKEANKEQK